MMFTAKRAVQCVLLFFSVIAFGQTTIQQQSNAEGFSWTTDLAYQSATLKVFGPRQYALQRTFAPKQALKLSFKELSKDYSPHGQYSFELVLAPIQKQHGQTTSISGAFQIQPSGATDPSLKEFAAKDQVILDDQIVEGSICVGLDCVNGENFGFDTLRIKENNTRIHFLDTSVTASFPSNDWRLVANDSANGGRNYLGIEDSTSGRLVFRVDAGSPENALVVDGDGEIAVGTTDAIQDIHVVRGNSPTLRLDQDTSGGFTPQAWDVGGNETQFFVRNASGADEIPFRIRPAAQSGLVTLGDGTGDTVTIDGQLVLNGVPVTPDYVFAPDFELMSIDEHARLMWRNHHLPNIEPAKTNAKGQPVISIGDRTQGVLKELEFAHIYIDQLHQRMAELEARLEALEQ